eukprot:622504-Amphidinium_carterae.1
MEREASKTRFEFGRQEKKTILKHIACRPVLLLLIVRNERSAKKQFTGVELMRPLEKSGTHRQRRPHIFEDLETGVLSSSETIAQQGRKVGKDCSRMVFPNVL